MRSPISMTCAAGMPMYTEGKTTGASARADIQLNPQDLLRVGGELAALPYQRLVDPLGRWYVAWHLLEHCRWPA
jgi:hypothetical protein